MNMYINDLLEKQEAEDKRELETNYANLIRREFEDAETILSMGKPEISLYTETPFVLDKALVRSAAEFSIHKHIASIIPYYHSHNFFEMIYVYEGICRQYINDDKKQIVLQKGEACFITPGTTHAILSSGQKDIILKMVIPAKMFWEFCNNAFEEKEELILKMEKPNEFFFFPLSLEQDGSVRWLFAKLLDELYSGTLYKHISIKSYLALLFVTLMRSQTPHRALPPRHSSNSQRCFASLACMATFPIAHGNKADFPENEFLYQVSEQISSHLQNAQLKAIAKNMGYSPRHLERLLWEKAGCTFSDVLQKLRMEKAAKLLTETNYPLELIAELTGYQTGAGFHKRFRSFFGTTPNQYRKSHRFPHKYKL